MFPNVLSIAGSDPSGGAGVQADLKTFAALQCYGMAAITVLTAQNTRGVTRLHPVPPDFVAAQIEAIFTDIKVAAVKIGLLGSGAIVDAVADGLARFKPAFVIVDPVLSATSGDQLASEDVVAHMRMKLFPLASLLTPNLEEAARLAESDIPTDMSGMQAVAEKLNALGAKTVLLKGGHLQSQTAEDLLLGEGLRHVFSARRIATANAHGTGCTLSAAIAAYLAHGLGMMSAISAAKTYLTGALSAADALDVGSGSGPLHHFHEYWNK